MTAPVCASVCAQVIQLPQNSVTLYGNQSTDDHDNLSYEWSLSPESKDKVVEMQVGGGPSLRILLCLKNNPSVRGP